MYELDCFLDYVLHISTSHFIVPKFPFSLSTRGIVIIFHVRFASFGGPLSLLMGRTHGERMDNTNSLVN